MQIDTDPMILRIAVEEHTELKERVRTVFDAWDHASRRKRRLFDISVEVLWVPVQDEFAEFMQLKTSQHFLIFFSHRDKKNT